MRRHDRGWDPRYFCLAPEADVGQVNDSSGKGAPECWGAIAAAYPGVYYEGCRPAQLPADERQPAEFAFLVASQLRPNFGREACLAPETDDDSSGKGAPEQK